MAYKKAFEKKSWAALQEELKAYSDRAMTTIQDHVTRPEDVLELANFMSTFHQYSLKNVGMIRQQFPGAYAVGSFKNFNEAGFRVQKGAKGIKIFVPTDITTFIGVDGTSKSLSTATPEEKARIASGEIKTQKTKKFKLGNVFDISQTDATVADLPKIFPNRHYDFAPVENGQGIFSALKTVGKQNGITFLEDTDRAIGNAKGAFMQAPTAEKYILLNPTNNLEETISTSIHELTHAFLHDVNLRREPALSKSSEEFQAELAAHITSMHFGLDTTEKAIPYIANWTQNGEALEEKVTLLSEVHQTSRKIISGVHQAMEQERHQEQAVIHEKPTEIAEPKPSRNRVTAEEIAKAKAVDLFDYAKSKGYEFTKDGKATYRNTEHDSLIIDRRKNAFRWNSRSLHGDPIAFVQKVEGVATFQEAVRSLIGNPLPEHRYVEEKKRPFVYDKTKEATSFEKARHYLVEERKLSPLLVDCLHDKGFIRQDNRNNVLFCWVDKDQIVGVSEKGTVANPNYPNGSWKHIRENSSGDHGFTFSFGQPKHLKFFEKSIDALSYATLHPEIKDTQLVAMEGLKDGAFKQYVEQAIQTLGQKPDSISFCVDNDTGGKNFSSKDSLHAFYEALGGDKLAHIQSEFPPKPPGLSQTTKWDMNDQLKYVTAQFSDVAYTNSWSQSEGIEL